MEAARHVHMHVEDFVYINSQHGTREENMLEHHVTFRMPDVGKQPRPKRGKKRSDVAAQRLAQAHEIEEAVRSVRGTPMQSAAFKKCVSMFGEPHKEAGSDASPAKHTGNEFCECPNCSLPQGMHVRIVARIAMD